MPACRNAIDRETYHIGVNHYPWLIRSAATFRRRRAHQPRHGSSCACAWCAQAIANKERFIQKRVCAVAKLLPHIARHVRDTIQTHVMVLRRIQNRRRPPHRETVDTACYVTRINDRRPACRPNGMHVESVGVTRTRGGAAALARGCTRGHASGCGWWGAGCFAGVMAWCGTRVARVQMRVAAARQVAVQARRRATVVR